MFIRGDSKEVLRHLPDNFVDLIVTDPPYGISFMGKDWDKALPDKEILKECFRVLKEGKLAFVMCSPRQDVLSRMIISLEDAGFKTGYTSIYWTYASGFPKAANISKLIDKRNGAIREVKKMEGAYVGFQPKPAVEIILVVSKGKTLTWLDDCRIPYQSEDDYNSTKNGTDAFMRSTPDGFREYTESIGYDKRINPLGKSNNTTQKGRFPANLLVSDDVLNDGVERKTGLRESGQKKSFSTISDHKWGFRGTKEGFKIPYTSDGDSGSYSRYFDLDKWYSTYPFIITPKASKSERNEGCESNATVKLLSPEIDEIVRCKEGLTVVVQLLRKVTSDMAVLSFNIDESGENILVQFPKDSISIISTEINRITELKTYNLLMHSLINEYTQDVNSLMVNGGNHVANVDNTNKPIQITTKKETELWLGVKNAVFKMLQKINEKGNWQDFTNRHATVKPIKLMSYLITLGSRENDLVLDPFVGSGTTYKAALQTHRRCIGIEINPEYIEIAKARVAPLLKQQKISSLF